ncbi:MAG TPA: PAS domain-containing protein [Vicinamibacterales bacterium]|nr:PAS domain-containing protein [Vicinamibacterales bacterium]
MSRPCLATWLIALAVVGVCPHTGAYGQTAVKTPKKVLALHVVRRDSPAFDDTFRAVISEAFHSQVDYYSEYIDLARLVDDSYHTALRNYLRERYVAGDSVDVVIASGPSVVSFLNRDPTLFQSVPIVFTTRPGLLAKPLSTGIISGIDLASTLSAALEAQPDTKHVFVISGVAPFDTLYDDILNDQKAAFSGRVTFHRLAGLSISDLEQRVRNLPGDAIIYYLSLSDDGAGHTFMPLDAVEMIAAAANVPVYSWHESALGHGIVGGRLHSSLHDARETARVVARVLQGESPQSIPVRTVDSYGYEFDWRQLQRWGISESRLPKGSVIRFREPTPLQRYRGYVIGGGLVVAAQMLLIGGLLIHRTRRRRAEEELRRSEARTSAILRALPDLMFVQDRNGTFVDFHARDHTLLLVPPEAFIGKTIRDIMPALGDRFMTAIEQAYRTHEPVVVEYELQLDELRHFEARIVPADDGRVLSIVRDVTVAKRALELNRVLAGRVIVSQEAERQRIARELHDDLSQKIALLNIDVSQLAHDLPIHEYRGRLDRLSSQAKEIATDLYDLSHELHPSRLQTLGLVESVRLLCQDVSQQHHLAVTFSASGLPDIVDPSVSLCLYRITQEALHNVAKHSRACNASVRLQRDDDEIVLVIEDSGVGFDPLANDHAGLGLISMRERVSVLKGDLVIEAADRGGTRIKVRVPLTPPLAHLALEPA